MSTTTLFLSTCISAAYGKCCFKNTECGPEKLRFPLSLKSLDKTCENKSNLVVREILQLIENGAKTVVAV